MNSPTLIPIVYQDDEIILANKRSGLASQGGAGVGRSADEELSAQQGQKIYLCHRLDKETSGLLLCAKNPQAANKWSRLIGEKSVKKEYAALCFGRPDKREGRISLPIKEKGGTKSALTLWTLQNVFVEDELLQEIGAAQFGDSRFFGQGSAFEKQAQKEDEPQKQNALPASGADEECFSLLRLSLLTGRTHQIRIHLAQTGLPIIGDDKYGDFKQNKAAKRDLGIKRLCLCAFRITLPLFGGDKTFQVPVDFFD